MTFFKKLGKKTVAQGLCAFGLYQCFNFLEWCVPSDQEDIANIMTKKFIENVGIPALATFGFEDMFSRYNNNELDLEPVFYEFCRRAGIHTRNIFHITQHGYRCCGAISSVWIWNSLFLFF